MGKKRKQSDKHPTQRVRKTWTRNPAQRAHSTRKGEKGYDRQRDKDDAQKEVEEEFPKQ